MNYKTNEKIEYLTLDWDSKVFSIKAGRINLLNEINEEDIIKIKSFVKHYDFVTIFNKNNNYRNNSMLSLLENTFLADLNIQFEKEVINHKDFEVSSNIFVSNNIDYDLELVQIAEKSFIFSRFFNDINLLNRGSKSI